MDVKGVGTRDVGIVYLVDEKTDYMNLDHIFVGYEKEPRSDKNRCCYGSTVGGREVGICASDDPSTMRSVTHTEKPNWH